jgi:pyridoxamine 5'-phosphate oxidase family protein
MSTFTDAEIEYLNRGPLRGLLGRLATVGPDGRPQRHPDVAVIVDDVASVDPWTPRYIEIRGHAETHLEGGEEVGQRLGAPFPFDSAWIRVRPRRVLAFGIETAGELSARDVA